MKKLAAILGLGLFLLLAACTQTPTTDLSGQALDYGQVRLNVVSDYREGFKDTSLNGQWDKGEFLIPGFEIRLTPIDDKGNVLGEPLSYITNQAVDPREGVLLELPVGIYQSELILPK
jgi:hypothetical protein